LDDDKATFAVKPGTRPDRSLKLVHHASDKLMVFTCHTAAATFSGILVCIHWEPDAGDMTTTTYYVIIVKYLSGIVVVASGHGY
jgi:hypothetical protein